MILSFVDEESETTSKNLVIQLLVFLTFTVDFLPSPWEHGAPSGASNVEWPSNIWLLIIMDSGTGNSVFQWIFTYCLYWCNYRPSHSVQFLSTPFFKPSTEDPPNMWGAFPKALFKISSVQLLCKKKNTQWQQQQKYKKQQPPQNSPVNVVNLKAQLSSQRTDMKRYFLLTAVLWGDRRFRGVEHCIYFQIFVLDVVIIFFSSCFSFF